MVQYFGSGGGTSVTRGATSRSRGGGGSAKKTPFEQLAARRGVDLAAERARGISQLRSGRQIGGISQSSKEGIASAKARTALMAGGNQTAPSPLTATTTEQGAITAGDSSTGTHKITEEMYNQVLSGQIDPASPLGIAVTEGRFKIVKENAATKVMRFLDLEGLEWDDYLMALGLAGFMASGIGAGASGAETTWRIGKTVRTPKGAMVTAKTIKLTTTNLGKFFSKKAMLFYAGWASAVAIGKWGEAESVEAFTFPSDKFYTPEAIRTGDWSLVNESDEAAREISDLSTWQKIGLWSPVSFAIGIPLKTKGVAWAQTIREKFHADQKQKQIDGTSEEDYWIQREAEKAQQEKDNIDYYNTERKKMFDYEQDARVATAAAKRKVDKKEMIDDADFWADRRAQERELEAADRAAIALFWLEYRRLAQKIQDENRPSNLKFGLL